MTGICSHTGVQQVLLEPSLLLATDETAGPLLTSWAVFACTKEDTATHKQESCSIHAARLYFLRLCQQCMCSSKVTEISLLLPAGFNSPRPCSTAAWLR